MGLCVCFGNQHNKTRNNKKRVDGPEQQYLELIALVGTRGPNVHKRPSLPVFCFTYALFYVCFTLECFTFEWTQVTERK
jgi:hypothetical protein